MFKFCDSCKIEAMKGKTFKEIKVNGSDGIIMFVVDDKEYFVMNHKQECCETILIEDICGDLNDIVGHPILEATETTNDERQTRCERISISDSDSVPWTFYKFKTIKGEVTISWCNTNNGYYSERVNIKHIQGSRKLFNRCQI